MKLLCKNPGCDSDTFREDEDDGTIGYFTFILIFCPVLFALMALARGFFDFKIDAVKIQPYGVPLLFLSYGIYYSMKKYFMPRFASKRRVVCVKCGAKDWRKV